MRFSDIYDRVIGYWPAEISIADGEPVGADGFLFSALSSSWSAVEAAVGHDDPWAELMVWTMFQVLHRESKRLYHEGIAFLRPGDVDPRLIEAQYRVGLSGEGWERELAAYETT